MLILSIVLVRVLLLIVFEKKNHRAVLENPTYILNWKNVNCWSRYYGYIVSKKIWYYCCYQNHVRWYGKVRSITIIKCPPTYSFAQCVLHTFHPAIKNEIAHSHGMIHKYTVLHHVEPIIYVGIVPACFKI